TSSTRTNVPTPPTARWRTSLAIIPSCTRSRVSSSHCRCSGASGSPAATRASSALVMSFTSHSSLQARDGVVDPLRQRECTAAVRPRDARRTPFPDGRDEVVELAPQRLAVRHGHLAAFDGRLLSRHAPEPPPFHLAAGVVHRDVQRRLHEPDLAYALAADTAGRDVGDAT